MKPETPAEESPLTFGPHIIDNPEAFEDYQCPIREDRRQSRWFLFNLLGAIGAFVLVCVIAFHLGNRNTTQPIPLTTNEAEMVDLTFRQLNQDLDELYGFTIPGEELYAGSPEEQLELARMLFVMEDHQRKEFLELLAQRPDHRLP